MSDTPLSQLILFVTTGLALEAELIFLSSLLPDKYVHISCERFSYVVLIVFCLYICLSHEILSFLGAGVASYLPLHPHVLRDLR